MSEIIMDAPGINTMSIELRAFSYREGSSLIGEVEQYMKRKNISPISHPLAVDICAGDGSGARILVDHKWEAQNITCIDRYQSPVPLVNGATWLYWDVQALARHLLAERPLPTRVEALRNKFDIVFLLLSPLTEDEVKSVCDFMVNQRGVIMSSKFFTP